MVTCQCVEFYFQDSRRVPKCRIITNLARMRTCRIIDKECGHVESIKSADMSNNHSIRVFRHSSLRDYYKFVYILESDPFSFKTCVQGIYTFLISILHVPYNDSLRKRGILKKSAFFTSPPFFKLGNAY